MTSIWALPFLTKCYVRPKKLSLSGTGSIGINRCLSAPKQMLCLLARWVPTRSVVVVADQAFYCAKIGQYMSGCSPSSGKASQFTRLRLDAALFEPNAPSTGRCNGPGRTALQSAVPVTDPVLKRD